MIIRSLIFRSLILSTMICFHGKNDFVEASKILPDQKFLILLDHQNNFGIIKIMSNVAKKFDLF